MAVEIYLRIYNPGGTIQAVVDNFRQLSYTKQVNAPGVLVFDLDGSHSAIDYLEQDAQIEVYRRDEANAIEWHADFRAFFAVETRSADDNGNTVYRAQCPGQMDLLGRAYVAYYAGSADRTEFTDDPAETVLKTLVTYNATSSGGTADGRVRDVDPWGDFISVEADGAGGGTVSVSCAWRSLLETLQEVASIGSLDFDLVKTGARAWQFRTDDLLGDDRSSTVVFALQYGNMRNPSLTRGSMTEKTVAIVGGQGLEENRTVEIVTGANYDGTVNSRELFYPATQYTTSAGLQFAGSVRLEEVRAKDSLSFDVIQTPATLYGKHYFLGDLVTGYFQGVTAVKQIVGVTVTITPNGEKIEDIQIQLDDP